ncbi:hypothetical protein [Streptomyces katrae]|uniref:hypothetical protein n=1 Tax=Streptomyces katrae TaxID=68223 RepID=UPI00068AAD37|nr:hypothetical protein [Streptomyces katrae]
MTKDQIGRLIGLGFGLSFIEANAGALPTQAQVPLRVAGVAAFLGLVLFGRRRTQAVQTADEPRGASFGGRYWLVVLAEVVAVAAGLAVINRVLHTPQATVGWIAAVVGVHFFGLATVWSRPELRTLGGGMTACGVLGLVLAFCGAATALVALIAGITPGVLLLGSVWWSGRTTTPARTA